MASWGAEHEPGGDLAAAVTLGADAALLAATTCFAALAVATAALPQTGSPALGWLILIVAPLAGLAVAWWLHARSFRPLSLLVLLASCLVAGGLGTFALFGLIGIAATKLPTGDVENIPYYAAAALPVFVAVWATLRERRMRHPRRQVLLVARVVAVAAFSLIVVLWFVPYARSVGDSLVFIGFVIPVLAGYVAGFGAAVASAFQAWRHRRDTLAKASECPPAPPTG